MKHLLLVFLLISSPTLAMHHSSDDEQIIFLLDLNIIEDQSNYVEDCIQKYDLIYVEDPFHEDAFEEFASLTKNTKNTYVVGDDLLVTNPKRLELASSINAVDAAILKVNQIGTLGDALLFALGKYPPSAI